MAGWSDTIFGNLPPKPEMNWDTPPDVWTAKMPNAQAPISDERSMAYGALRDREILNPFGKTGGGPIADMSWYGRSFQPQGVQPAPNYPASYPPNYQTAQPNPRFVPTDPWVRSQPPQYVRPPNLYTPGTPGYRPPLQPSLSDLMGGQDMPLPHRRFR